MLEKAKNNPKNIRFSELETLLSLWGWTFDHQTGSHQIWYSPQGFWLSIQSGDSGKAKAYQVKQFLARLEQEKNG